MTPQDLEKLTQLLSDEEALVRQELEGVAVHDPASKDGFIPKPADYGGEREEEDAPHRETDSENNVAVEHELEHRLEEILKAQGKLKNGSYGKCEKCGVDIPVERLLAVPMTPFCFNCAESFSS